MATGLDFSGISRFDPHADASSLSQRWNVWIKRFQRFIVAMDIKDPTRRRALLLYLAGPEVETIFDNLPETGESKDFDKAVEKLTEYFSPKKNIMYETHVFRQAQQREDETLDQFHMRLRELAQNCEFADIDKEIKIQLVEKCTSTRVRRKALREQISLEDLLKYGRTMETSDRQIAQLESLHQSGIQVNNLDAPKSCFFCGGTFPHPQGRASCPASRKTCGHCGKLGHFAQVCKMKSGASRNLPKSRIPRQTTSSISSSAQVVRDWYERA